MQIFQTTGGTATALIASATTAVQDTFADLAPIIALVVGMILAFILARYIMGLFKHAGSSTGNVKSDLNMYHHSDAEMKAKNIDPMGISQYDEGRF
jgi:putative flippase GtrA